MDYQCSCLLGTPFNNINRSKPHNKMLIFRSLFQHRTCTTYYEILQSVYWCCTFAISHMYNFGAVVLSRGDLRRTTRRIQSETGVSDYDTDDNM